MAAEMAEQPIVLERLIERFDSSISRIRTGRFPNNWLASYSSHGDLSDHAAIFGRYMVEPAAGRPVSLAAPNLHTLYATYIDYTS